MTTYTTIKRLISKIERDFNSSIPDIDIIEWAGECLSKLPVKVHYEMNEIRLKLNNHKALLPNGFIAPNQLAYETEYSVIPLIKSTHSLGLNKEDYRYEYTIQDCYIICSEQEGNILMQYYTYPYDENGYPMIPDDDLYLEVLSKYVNMMYLYPKYLKNEPNMNNIYPEAVLSYNTSVRKLKASKQMPQNVDDYEIMKRTQYNLLPRYDRFNSFFGSFNKENFNNVNGKS